jgi:glycosyltransferase involved in cell wall biosynthesis
MRIAMLGLKGIPASYGGVERYTEEVAARLVERGHEVLVYCRAHYTPLDLAHKPYRGIRLIRLPSLYHKGTDTLSHTFLSTLDVLRRHTDVVIYHSLGNTIFTPIPRLIGKPTILVLHGQEWREEKWKGAPHIFFRASERASFALATRVAVIARWLQKDLHQRYGHEPAFVSTGIALPEPGPTKHLPTLGLTPRGYLLFVGRLVSEKGAHLLLEAYRKLHTRMPLVIVGDAPHEEKYHRRLRTLATPGVMFLGFRYGAELAELYSQAYLYILPSACEGIALTLLEALAYNNCVLVSAIPANLEAAGPSGYFFQSGDSDELCQVLRELLARPDLVAERRGQARAHIARRYDWDRVADYYEQLCLELTTRGKGVHA